ncbi:DUF421 domain-containing protein [Dethiothermospora halolimnae]|uniref:DUF421 domain-containing protein n=1 Tax=Dethiothermospora halolimnae TaxID=3114390 RepID=UPI003CCB87B9
MEFFARILALIAGGTILLRVAGRKSISQMTIAQTIIMISIGSLIVQPIGNKSVLRTLGIAAIFIGFLLFVEWIQIKSNAFENFITGKSKVIIENGKVVPKNLKKLRLTVDQLEIRLRQQGISSISHVKTATLEANGQLGYELKRHAKPLTIGEFEKMMANYINVQNKDKTNVDNIFSEVVIKEHELRNNNRLKQ